MMHGMRRKTDVHGVVILVKHLAWDTSLLLAAVELDCATDASCERDSALRVGREVTAHTAAQLIGVLSSDKKANLRIESVQRNLPVLSMTRTT